MSSAVVQSNGTPSLAMFYKEMEEVVSWGLRGLDSVQIFTVKSFKIGPKHLTLVVTCFP